MSSQEEDTILFYKFPVTEQKTKFSYALVNLKPIFPGHVLVCPLRNVPRLHDLREEECSDLFLAVQRVSRVIELEYSADSVNVAIQDGPLAGQTVPHVHVHIIPRRINDLPNVHDIYELLHDCGDDEDRKFQILKKNQNHDNFAEDGGPDGNAKVKNLARTIEDMRTEANRLRKLF
ncbi:HIT-like protein [Nadsonia fulvescens var. elongata DSM 6958]|uniref:Bis(5'-adenosyl)-triphosphatase n=1 Tax=Nadsonia fulvescens var. elongata DSM 6958 TaxID=857566 RepID=A0A1E3PDN1_9ASCO|nr:HIT-like protein [Nadsonia fulvescens var. elongata DSM 6958]